MLNVTLGVKNSIYVRHKDELIKITVNPKSCCNWCGEPYDRVGLGLDAPRSFDIKRVRKSDFIEVESDHVVSDIDGNT